MWRDGRKAGHGHRAQRKAALAALNPMHDAQWPNGSMRYQSRCSPRPPRELRQRLERSIRWQREVIALIAAVETQRVDFSLLFGLIPVTHTNSAALFQCVTNS